MVYQRHASRFPCDDPPSTLTTFHGSQREGGNEFPFLLVFLVSELLHSFALLSPLRDSHLVSPILHVSLLLIILADWLHWALVQEVSYCAFPVAGCLLPPVTEF